MRNNGVFAVGPKGAMALAADDAWHEYCTYFGIQEPFFRNPPASKKDINNYRKLRDNWQLDWIFENEGYAAAEWFARMRNDEINNLWQEFEKYYTPCVNANDDLRECNIFCKDYENCVKEGFKHWN